MDTEDLAALLDGLTEPPTSPREAQAWLEERSEELAATMAREVSRIVGEHLERYASTLTASGDLSALDGMEQAWRITVTEVVGQYTAGMYLGGALTAWLAGPGADLDPEEAIRWAAVVNEDALAYQAAATNRVVGATQSMWTDVRTRTVEGLQSGMSNEALKDEIQSITGYSEYRADAIGRTETMAAYNGGDMAGARALGENGPTHKRWLAALDARTREDHAAADGQTVLMSEPFVVGGVLMDRPLDPAAPAEQVVHCRCVVEMLYPEDIEDS